jgi:hypothetical protein
MIPVVPRCILGSALAHCTKGGNEIERLKHFLRTFSRFEKLEIVFLAFLYFGLIVAVLRLM